MTLHPIRPGIGYGTVAGQALGPASPAVDDASGGPLADRRDEPSDRIRSLTLQLQAETKAEREAFIAEIATAVIKARRIALEDRHGPGIQEFARQVCVFLEVRLDAARAILEREL